MRNHILGVKEKGETFMAKKIGVSAKTHTKQQQRYFNFFYFFHLHLPSAHGTPLKYKEVGVLFPNRS